MRKLFLSAAAAALLAGCSMMDGGGGAEPAAMADMTPEERNAYVAMAAASDLFEIQSGQMAATRGRRPAVREFGQMLVTHHTQTTQQLTAAARAAGVNPPPPTLLPMQRQMLERLQATRAGNFDMVFLRQQVRAHEMALGLHSNYARNGDTPALRAAATGAVPVIQQHLNRARQLD